MRQKAFMIFRINGIFPVALQSCKVRLLMCNIWQTSLFVRKFFPFRCGVRFFKDYPIVSNISSKTVKNEATAFDFLYSIFLYIQLVIIYLTNVYLQYWMVVKIHFSVENKSIT